MLSWPPDLFLTWFCVSLSPALCCQQKITQQPKRSFYNLIRSISIQNVILTLLSQLNLAVRKIKSYFFFIYEKHTFPIKADISAYIVVIQLSEQLLFSKRFDTLMVLIYHSTVIYFPFSSLVVPLVADSIHHLNWGSSVPGCRNLNGAGSDLGGFRCHTLTIYGKSVHTYCETAAAPSETVGWFLIKP